MNDGHEGSDPTTYCVVLYAARNIKHNTPQVVEIREQTYKQDN